MSNTTSPHSLFGTHSPARWASNAEILLWQSRIRCQLVLASAAVALVLRLLGAVDGSVWAGAWMVAAYLLAVGATAAVAHYSRRGRWWLVLLTSAADIAFLFGISARAVSPASYERTLFWAFALIGATEFYFGQRLARTVTGMVAAAYIALVYHARSRGAALPWGESLWTLGAFLVAVALFIAIYGGFRARLMKIVRLFERVEDGDFTGTYDVEGDLRPDAITAVGRAYNRVREQLATMVLTDPLSGCLNRRGLEMVMAREVARGLRHGSPLSLIVLDVDHFKEVNDRFGHLAGDAVVREMGMLLRDTGRAGDVVARLGGDEFALLLPDTGPDGASQLATRIRDAAARRAFVGVAGRMPITVSVGVVSDLVTDADIAQSLYARADEALYEAKEGGRDRVEVWGGRASRVAC